MHVKNNIPRCTNPSSCCKWSLGTSTEHSIANAYIEAIKNAKHFVYIENQVCLFLVIRVVECTLTVLVLHHCHLGQAEAGQ